MEYPSVLAALAAFFGFVAVLAFGSKLFSPEPPPRGGVLDRRQKSKVSFAEFHRERVKESARHAAAAYGQERRSA
jgi:hypothetical protein